MATGDIGDIIRSLEPEAALDVACGCGAFTRSIAGACRMLVAVDSARSLTSRWRADTAGGAIQYCVTDGRCMGIRSRSFPLVYERHSLHHVEDWERVVDEMCRVSTHQVFVEEPVDDPRSPAKRATIEAQALFLEVQKEVGFPHYPHLDPERVTAAMAARGTVRSAQLVRREDPVIPGEFFASFARFANESSRAPYWIARLDEFTTSLRGMDLCETDVVVVLAEIV